MLESTIQLRSVLSYVNGLTASYDFKRAFFKDSEWPMLAELLKVFKVFLKPLTDLHGQNYVTNLFSLLYIY